MLDQRRRAIFVAVLAGQATASEYITFLKAQGEVFSRGWYLRVPRRPMVVAGKWARLRASIRRFV